MFYSEYRAQPGHRDGGRAHGLLDSADVVLHFNGRRFDVPHLNREFLLAGLTPPSPYKQIDLLSGVVRQGSSFPSNKLAVRVEGTGPRRARRRHGGFDLWKRLHGRRP
jgi:hypothetical protein